MKTQSTNNWKRMLAAIGIAFGLMASATIVQAITTQRPIQDFLATQGTFCFPDGSGGCLLFVPPDPNFLGWTNDLDSDVIRFAGVDYAGLADAYPTGKKPVIDGTVTERPLKDGRTEVTVLLHTKNANVWVIELDLTGDVLAQIASKSTLFGHRPADVLGGKGQALADTFLHVVFINTAGAPLPDLIQLINFPAQGQELKFVAFGTHAKGPLTAEFGVPEGTPGRCTITQTGLFMTKGNGLALQDGFPVEDINLRVVGR